MRHRKHLLSAAGIVVMVVLALGSTEDRETEKTSKSPKTEQPMYGGDPRVAELDAAARAIPASDALGNLIAYQELLELVPGSKRYKAKVAHYQAKVYERAADRATAEATGLSLQQRKLVWLEITEAQEEAVHQASAEVDVVDLETSEQHSRIFERLDDENLAQIQQEYGVSDDAVAKIMFEGVEREWHRERADLKEKQAVAARKAKYGPAPTPSAWDGSVSPVKSYLKAIVNDPGSLEYDGWSKIVFVEEKGWSVRVDWRAKNALGGYVRQTNIFFIRHGRVVAVQPPFG